MTLLQPTAPRWQANYDLGWIGFVHHHSLLADLICWATRWWRHAGEPCVSHVFIVAGPDTCIESNPDGVDTGSLSSYFTDPRFTIYLRRPRWWTPNTAATIVTEAARHVGLTPYDYPLLFADGLAYSIIGRLFNWLTRGAFERDLLSLAQRKRGLICDELAAVALQIVPSLSFRGTLREPAYENNPQKLFSDDEIFEPDVTVIPGRV